jgi:aminopeptidase
VWCTTQRVSRASVAFVTNLPTEEIFTAPHRNSATGRVRAARPVAHNGVVLEHVELEFQAGRVVRASATSGHEHLLRLLAIDGGSNRLGEAALVPDAARLPWTQQAHHHILLDENAGPHIALGSAYPFCSRAWLPLALNSSQLHLDLPLEAKVELM